MSDGGRDRASLGIEVWKSFQNVDAERSAVRSIAWLGVWRGMSFKDGIGKTVTRYDYLP
jgi:hypothetical protein